MTELEILDRDIAVLKELLRVAWQKLAFQELATEEMRETRMRMKQSSADLRHNLELFETERKRLRKIAVG